MYEVSLYAYQALSSPVSHVGSAARSLARSFGSFAWSTPIAVALIAKAHQVRSNNSTTAVMDQVVVGDVGVEEGLDA